MYTGFFRSQRNSPVPPVNMCPTLIGFAIQSASLGHRVKSGYSWG